MPRIELESVIRAPIERAFDLARSIDLHVVTQSRHGEQAVGGVTSGLIGPGEEVTWRAKHFGIWQTITSRIVQFDRPRHFRDSMVRGPFRRFDHDHHFERHGDATLMRDSFDFTSPFGVVGDLANVLFLTRHMAGLLEERNAILKRVAESDEWKSFLDEAG